MERGSSKHSAHVDDDMAREAQSFLRGGPVSARDNEWRDSELVSDDQPEPQWLPDESDHPEGAPPGISGTELEARSELGRAVPRSALPGDREAVLHGAEEMGVTPQVRAELERLPADRVYHTVYEIWEALGHHNEA